MSKADAVNRRREEEGLFKADAVNEEDPERDQEEEEEEGEGFFSERSSRSVERKKISKPFNHFVFVWRRSCSQLSTDSILN